MASVHLGSTLRQIQGLFEVGTVAGLTDGQLLDRYLASRDESAFAALVVRHGPMVLGVCRAVLNNSPEVEDAFQATFLVMIRKAGTIRGRDAVGGWLHRVAQRVAVQAVLERSRKSTSRARGGRSVRPHRGRRDPCGRGLARSVARGGRAAAGAIPPADRALLPRRQDPCTGGARAALGRGDGASPPGRCPRPAPLTADPARGRYVERCPRRDTGGRGDRRGPGRLDRAPWPGLPPDAR